MQQRGKRPLRATLSFAHFAADADGCGRAGIRQVQAALVAFGKGGR